MTAIEFLLAVLVALDIVVGIMNYHARRLDHEEFMAKMRELHKR